MMKTSSPFRRISLLFASIVLILACDFATSATEPNTPGQPEATQTLPDEEPTATQVDATATESAQITLEPTSASPAGPRCTVLQDLNLRSGPGRAYNPPITTLPANTELIPLAYEPVGIPGGSWVQVQNPTNQQKGWVSAGADFVDCNLDLTTLPKVVVAPPPTPVPPRAQSSNEDGTCGQGGIFDEQQVHVYDCGVIFSGDFPMQFQVFKDGQEIGSADGVQNVVFRVEQDGNTIYTHTENNAPYCIFGGDGPCNSWVFEDFVYKWESGGAVIEAGEYKVNIDATVDDPSINLHWERIVKISLQ
jgi:Bacterial SH3 domain